MNSKNQSLKRPLFIFGMSITLVTVLFMLTGDAFVYIFAFALLIGIPVLCIFRKYHVCKIMLVITLAFITAALSFFYNEKTVVGPSLLLYGETVNIKGTLTEYPTQKENSILLTLSDCEINGEKTKLKINLYCKNDDGVQIGDIVEAEGAEIFSVPDNNEYYYHTLSTGAWLGAYSEFAFVSDNVQNNSFMLKIKRFRYSITERLTLNLGKEKASIAASLLLGDKTNLSQEFTSQLRISGASHLFAVSGMHLALWTGIIFFILRKRSRVKVMPNIFAIAFVIFYMLITGLSPSVIRAGIMLITIFIGKIIKRESDPLNSIGLAAGIMLIFNIYLAGNISFLLSLSATAGIVTLYPYFFTPTGSKKLNLKYRLLNIKNGVLLSLCALLFTAPISGFFFGSVSLLSPVSTVVCSLPVSAVILTAFISVCFNLSFIFKICSYCCSGLLYLIKFLSQFEFCLYPINMTRIYIYYGILTVVILTVYLFSKSDKSKRVIISVLCCCMLILTSEIIVNFVSYGKTEIFISACGNATNISVSSYNSGYNVLIGTGENYDDYKIMQDYMKTKGIYRFDSVLVPRDSKAEGGMLDKYQDFYAKNIYDAENFVLTLKNEMTYENINCSVFSAGILSNDEIKIVFSFYPGGDFEEADEKLLNGNYLICRGQIPKNLPSENFDNIIILSDKMPPEITLPENAVSTAQTGNIKLVLG